MGIKFGSVCSGIEAASVAWNPLGWEAAWFSEIEPFPCAVLAYHYPNVPNLGDMTTLPGRIKKGEIEVPDILCGGTPCQAFSVAGQRKSLDDARGNLSLVFCEIANELDAVRTLRGDPPTVIFWENVPGVLNTRDNAFGCFLGELCGSGFPLRPSEREGDNKWPSAGVVTGPKRKVAWRVLDAQFFGVPQRRRRVFVIASARKGFNPAEILFERTGVSGDFETSGSEGEGTAERVEKGFASSSDGVSAFASGSFSTYSKSESAGVVKGCGGDYGGGSETLLVDNRVLPPLTASDLVKRTNNQNHGLLQIVKDCR